MWTRWYGPLVDRVQRWALEEDSIRAVLIVGSQARLMEPADEWSDLDLVLFHERPEELIESTRWIASLGEVVLSMIEPTAVLASRERRVLFSDGKDVDFAVFSTKALEEVTRSPEGNAVLRRGYHVLVDKDGKLTGLEESVATPPPVPARIPDVVRFQSIVSDFWYHVQWVAKKLRRGELWTAKSCTDGMLKALLLRMLEWQVLAHRGENSDVWHNGRFLDSWVDPGTRAKLPGTFARYETHDVARALMETAQLFAAVARDVAHKQQLNYPSAAEEFVVSFSSNLLKDGGLFP